MTLIPGLMAPHAEDSLRIATYLQRFAGVSTPNLALAVERQRKGEMRFSEAVFDLGFATRAMVDAAVCADIDPAAIQLARPASLLKSAHDALHPHSERIRALRTELLLRSGAVGPQLLAVVSAGVGEGRSVLAAELAIAFAQLDQPTLLIDADLRRPCQHQLFNTENRRGLAALATGDQPRLQAVEGLPQLALLTAGAALPNPQDLLGGPALAQCLRHWRSTYRHVVIDTSAAFDNADALTLAGSVDTVLPLARRHHSSMPLLKTLLERLRSASARQLGMVLLEF